MTAIQAIILGIIQGLTEFLPVSSSAHLSFIPALFGWQNTSVDFDVFLHAATLLAVLIYFRKDLVNLVKGIFSKDETIKTQQRNLLLQLGIAFAVLVPFVVLLKNQIDATESMLLLTYILFVLFGIPLIFIEKIYKNNKLQVTELNWKSSLLIGFTQCLALFSGVSRSGITIMTGMTQGLTKDSAKRFTFLLSIPTIAAGFALELLKMFKNFQFQESGFVIFAGTIAAFLSGMLAIKIMMDLLKHKSLAVFGYYRVILGIILILVTVF